MDFYRIKFIWLRKESLIFLRNEFIVFIVFLKIARYHYFNNYHPKKFYFLFIKKTAPFQSRLKVIMANSTAIFCSYLRICWMDFLQTKFIWKSKKVSIELRVNYKKRPCSLDYTRLVGTVVQSLLICPRVCPCSECTQHWQS